MNTLFKLEISADRIFGLDILRALAILFVVLGHSIELLPPSLGRMIEGCLVFDGVSIFFVLSGFLIGGILIKLFEQSTPSWSLLQQFWIRRWFRTLPNYFLILSTLCLIHLFFTDDIRIGQIGRYFVFSQNLYTPHPIGFFPEAWSLSVEEWFYLLIPVVITGSIVLFRLASKKAVIIAAVLMILCVTLFRYYRLLSLNEVGMVEWDLYFRKQVITRLDGLMYGVIGAYFQYYHFRKWIRYKKTLLVAGIALFLSTKFYFGSSQGYYGLYSCVFSFTLISIATLALLPFLSDLKKGKAWISTPITYVSLISYSMYLINLSLIKIWVIDRIPWGRLFGYNGYMELIRYGAYWLFVIACSILLYKYFEVPMMKLRDSSLFKRRVAQVAPQKIYKK